MEGRGPVSVRRPSFAAIKLSSTASKKTKKIGACPSFATGRPKNWNEFLVIGISQVIRADTKNIPSKLIWLLIREVEQQSGPHNQARRCATRFLELATTMKTNVDY